MKAEPITSSEISSYLPSTEVASKVDITGTYATMAYYSAEDCLSAGVVSGCSTDYDVSDVKQVVDIWKTNYASGATTARLLEYDDFELLGYEWGAATPSDTFWTNSGNIPSWVYSDYMYWTMESKDDAFNAWRVRGDGNLSYASVGSSGSAVRPVIVLPKSVLSS